MIANIISNITRRNF